MVLERIKQYIDYKGITIAALEKSIGMGNSSLRKTLASGTGIGSDKLEKILMLFPELSAEWLLRGDGEMIKKDDYAVTADWQIVEISRLILELEKQKEEAMKCLERVLKDTKPIL